MVCYIAVEIERIVELYVLPVVVVVVVFVVSDFVFDDAVGVVLDPRLLADPEA